MVHLAAAFAAAMTAAAPALANPDEGPLACADRTAPAPAPSSTAPTAESLAGTYRCSVEGLTITLSLRKDGSFDQRMDVDKTWADDEPGSSDFPNLLSGRWRTEGAKLVLYQRPQRAPTLRLVSTGRDPAVWMRVEVRQADGAPARLLQVRSGEYRNHVSALVDGIVSVPRSYSWEPGPRWVVRSGDEKVLAEFAVRPNGPNLFRFEYRPSEVEPFEIESMLVGDPARAIMVPLGTGAALLTRDPAP